MSALGGATLQTWFPDWLLGKMRETAQRRRMSHAEIIRQAVGEYLATTEEQQNNDSQRGNS